MPVQLLPFIEEESLSHSRDADWSPCKTRLNRDSWDMIFEHYSTQRWSIEPVQVLLPPSDRDSGVLHAPSLVTGVPFWVAKEMIHSRVLAWMSPCENTALFHPSSQLIFEIDSIHITLTLKGKHTVINIQTVYCILSVFVWLSYFIVFQIDTH